MVSFLQGRFGLPEAHVFRVDGPVNLNRLMMIYDLADRPDLKFQAFRAGLPKRIRRKRDIFKAVRERDILLHHRPVRRGPFSRAHEGRLFPQRRRSGGFLLQRRLDAPQFLPPGGNLFPHRAGRA